LRYTRPIAGIIGDPDFLAVRILGDDSRFAGWGCPAVKRAGLNVQRRHSQRCFGRSRKQALGRRTFRLRAADTFAKREKDYSYNDEGRTPGIAILGHAGSVSHDSAAVAGGLGFGFRAKHLLGTGLIVIGHAGQMVDPLTAAIPVALDDAA